MSDVVIGEAVVVEVRVAQLPTRVVALVIDLVVQLATLIGANMLLATASLVTDDALAMALQIVISVLILVGYPVIFETLTRGRSLGKLALGLRVVSDDGSPERFRQALFRGLASVPEIWTLGGAPALISSLISQKGKRLGDIFAGTIVIAERGPREAPPPEMPYPLAAWASTLELSQLPNEVANTARQYLLRWHQLAPAVQHDMGIRIATQVAAYVTPPPPPGAPPHAYLAAVLAERRRREEIRLARAHGAAHRPPQQPWGQPRQQGEQTQHQHQQHQQHQQPWQQPPHPGIRPPVPGPDVPMPLPAAPMPLAGPPSGEVGPTPGGFVPPS